MHTKPQLVAAFRTAGLAAGDLVLVHSSLRKLGPAEGGADTVIDALLESVAPGGTIALPTHTWKIVNEAQPVFHQSYTPSNVGTLSNVFRARPGVLRSLHPTHSIAAIGPRAAALVKDHELDGSPCPASGPYGRLRDWGGKILIIGEGLNCCTYFHGCEEWAGMPWAVTQRTTTFYMIRSDGSTVIREYHRHYVSTWERYPRMEPHLLGTGAMRITHLGECALRLLDARRAADCVISQLRLDAGIVLPEVLPESQ